MCGVPDVADAVNQLIDAGKQVVERAMTLPAAAGPLLAWVLRREGEFTAEPDHGLDAESVRAILTALYREGVVAHGPL